MNRKDILKAASSAVHAEDKDHDYGKPEDNFATIAKLWNTYLEATCDDPDLSVCLGSRDVAVMMILLKIARAAMSTKADHWVDIAGYAACGGEIDSYEAVVDEKEPETLVLQSLGDVNGNGPFEIRFKAKKEE